MRFVAIILALCLGIACHAQVPGSITGNGQTPGRGASILVNLSATGYTIPSDFLGFSVEAADLVNGYYQGTTGNNGSMISVLQLLGANGVFRVGGLTSSLATPPALSQGIANNFQSFLAGIASGWANKVIYTLDLFANNSATAATQAGYIATAFGATKSYFAFENEPFSSGHYSFGSVATYQAAWNAYYTAVTGSVSSANYVAWDDGDLQDAQTIISGLTPNLSGLTLVTGHWYNTGGVSIPASKLITSVRDNASSYQQPANYAGTKMRMTETNSIASSGVAGESNALMSAAWFLNYAISLAGAGYAGVNIHNHYASVNNPSVGVYNPLVQLGDNNFTAGPIFYGMMLFSKIEGQQTVASSVAGNANVMAIATKGGNGNANILAINNDVYSPSVITPNQSAAWTTANVLQIKSGAGAGCSDLTATIGGQAIGESGAWSGAPFALANGASVTLGPCEAALIQIQP